MKNYLLSHGFGFTNDYWRNLVPLLDGEIHFFDELNLDKSKTYVGIGHSLGFLKLNNSGLKFEALVALQGFLNYCGNLDRMQKVRKIALQKVRNKIIENKNESLRQFRSFCGYADNVTTDIPLSTLLAELEMMEHSYKHCGVKTLVIGSSDDVIVPMSVINDNFSNLKDVTILQLNTGRHALGYLHPVLIAKNILSRCLSSHARSHTPIPYF